MLEPLRAKLPAKVFNEEVPQAPSTAPQTACEAICARPANCWPAGMDLSGWRPAKRKGRGATLEYLDSGGGERIILLLARRSASWESRWTTAGRTLR